MTLTEMIQEIPEGHRDLLNALRISSDPQGYLVHIDIAKMVPALPNLPQEAGGGYQAEVDLDDLPTGVSFTGRVRHPGYDYYLNDHLTPEQAIQELHESGLIGPVNASRFDGDSPGYPAWLIKPERTPGDPRA